jgi:hypothetical protein
MLSNSHAPKFYSVLFAFSEFWINIQPILWRNSFHRYPQLPFPSPSTYLVLGWCKAAIFMFGFAAPYFHQSLEYAKRNFTNF